MANLWKYILTSWERVLFGLVGFVCLIFTFIFLSKAEITAATAVFAMSMFSFFYSNLSRFKKFKGLGFEAELWEDKQTEAADLIEKLKNVVSVYTREIVMNNVLRGRLGGTDSWQERWDLFDELVGRHTELGQKIDFHSLRHQVESIFFFDICSPLAQSINQSINVAKSDAQKRAKERFRNPISDHEGFNNFQMALRSIENLDTNLFEQSKNKNIAEQILTNANRANEILRKNFEIELNFKDGVVERLQSISDLMNRRPIEITPELVSWADSHEAFSN